MKTTMYEDGEVEDKDNDNEAWVEEYFDTG